MFFYNFFSVDFQWTWWWVGVFRNQIGFIGWICTTGIGIGHLLSSARLAPQRFGAVSNEICFLLRESTKRAKEAYDLLKTIPMDSLNKGSRDLLELAESQIQASISYLGIPSINTKILEKRPRIVSRRARDTKITPRCAMAKPEPKPAQSSNRVIIPTSSTYWILTQLTRYWIKFHYLIFKIVI